MDNEQSDSDQDAGDLAPQNAAQSVLPAGSSVQGGKLGGAPGQSQEPQDMESRGDGGGPGTLENPGTAAHEMGQAALGSHEPEDRKGDSEGTS
ncbi:MAG: hypothetical protein ACR2MY_08630 [Candidatus Dormibacteria bacterium]